VRFRNRLIPKSDSDLSGTAWQICRLSQLPSCWAKLALISIFLNQILSGFKLISVIKNQIVMLGESGGFAVSVNLFSVLKMQN
jgi:hypothetical protein